MLAWPVRFYGVLVLKHRVNTGIFMRLLLKVDLVLEFANVFVSSLVQNVFSSIKLLHIFLANRKGKNMFKKKNSSPNI